MDIADRWLGEIAVLMDHLLEEAKKDDGVTIQQIISAEAQTACSILSHCLSMLTADQRDALGETILEAAKKRAREVTGSLGLIEQMVQDARARQGEGG